MNRVVYIFFVYNIHRRKIYKMKTVILTADNLGIDIPSNRAIFEAFHAGNIQNAGLLANGECFNDAVENVIKQCPDLAVGIQLNITEGKSLITEYDSFLTANDGYYNLSCEKLLFFSNNSKYLNQIEAEFCSQIDYILSKDIKPAFISSHGNIHAIPGIFETVCRLADKYNIKNIRTQTELLYFVKELYRHTESKYLGNAGKNLLLNTATWINQSTLKKYNINTNNYFIGILYSGQMDRNTILSGIKQLPDNTVTEIVLHPTTNKWKHLKYIEYKTLIENSLKNEIQELNTNILSWNDVFTQPANKNENEEEQNVDSNSDSIRITNTGKYETVVHSITLSENTDTGKGAGI